MRAYTVRACIFSARTWSIACIEFACLQLGENNSALLNAVRAELLEVPDLLPVELPPKSLNMRFVGSCDGLFRIWHHRMPKYLHASIHACIHACMDAHKHICTYARMHVLGVRSGYVGMQGLAGKP